MDLKTACLSKVSNYFNGMMIFGDFSKPKFNEMVAAGQVNKGKGGGGWEMGKQTKKESLFGFSLKNLKLYPIVDYDVIYRLCKLKKIEFVNIW